MTFEEIKKNCVPGETILVSETGTERIYIGFRSPEVLFAVMPDHITVRRFSESDVKNWKIKQEPKKLCAWINLETSQVQWFPGFFTSLNGKYERAPEYDITFE